MLFNTIYFYSNNTEEQILKELENVGIKRGICILNIYSKEINAIIPYYIKMANNLDEGMAYIIEEFSGYIIPNRTSISYTVIEDELSLYNTYMDLIKHMQPRYNYQNKINEYIKSIYKTTISIDDFIKNVLNNEVDFDKGAIDLVLSKQSFKCFDKENTDKIDNVSGIYFMYNQNEGLVYIGQSIHIQQRLKEHLSKHSNTHDICESFKYFKFVEVSSIDMLTNYEVYSINIYQPKLNVKDVYTYNSERYTAPENCYIREYGSIENIMRINFAVEDIKERLNKHFDDFEKNIINFNENENILNNTTDDILNNVPN